MGLLSFLFGGGKTTQSGTQSQTTSGSTTPTYDPKFQPLLDMLLRRGTSSLSSSSALPRGFDTNAVEGINDAFKGAGANLSNSLTARGLANSPVAAPSLAGLEMGRAAQIGDLGTKLPLLEQEAKQREFASLMQLLGFGRGTSTTGTMTGTSTGVTQQPVSIAPLLGTALGALLGGGGNSGGGG